MTLRPIEDALEKYEYSLQMHDDNTCTLRDRQDNVLVDKGTPDEGWDKLIEIMGDIEVMHGVVMNTIYFWRPEAPSETL
jgi:hypothetical protein